MLNQATNNRQVEGIQICQVIPKMNHLLFVDDNIVFCKANMDANLQLQGLLQDYAQAWGQFINRDKTSMIFSKNIERQARDEIMSLWGIAKHTQYDKCLGLPPVIGKSKAKTFAEIKKKVWQKLHSWKEKFLSQGKKEFLIKIVALAIPTYTMSCFKLLDFLCTKLERLTAWFWWGEKMD